MGSILSLWQNTSDYYFGTLIQITKWNKTYLYYKLLHPVSSKNIKTVHLNVTLCTHINYGVYRKRDNGITVRKVR